MRLAPRTLFGRVSLFLLLAVVVAQGGSVADFLISDHAAHMGIVRSQVFEQTEATLRLLRATPPALRAGVADQLSLFTLCYSLDAAPRAHPGGEEDEEAGHLQERLRNLLAPYAAGPPRLELRDQADHGCDRYRAVSGLPFSGRPDHHHRFSGLLLSVPLEDGRWLNADGRIVIPSYWEMAPLLPVLSMVLAVLLTAFFILARETGTLRRLAEAAERLGRGDGGTRLEESGPAEVVSLIRAFNTMQDRITRFMQDRTRLLAAISHDLRTPLTSLRLKAELIEDEEVAAQITATAEEMEAIVRSTLDFAGADALNEAPRVMDLASVVESLVDDMAELDLPVIFQPSPRIAVSCRPVALRRAVRNLLENALRYGGCARVCCRREPGQAVIEIADDGPGIPPALLDEVVKPFVRLEASRNAATGGIGLGLAIARTVLLAHGGDLRLENRPEGGLTARLILPLPAA